MALPGKFRFDSRLHQYWLEHGERRYYLPGTTEILKTANRFDDKWIPHEARERGSLVHQLTEDHDLGLVDLNTVEGPLRPWCLAYLKFLAEERPRYDRIELGAFHRKLGFATIIDRVGACRGRGPMVMNIKTGAPAHANELQSAAEILAYDKRRSNRKRAILQLKSNGDYRLKWNENFADFDEFLECLKTWRKECHDPARNGPLEQLDRIR